jgi:hypothetical protein
LPEQLIESELFGHERGAFTGADRLRRGAFETAGNGTLFLDEVARLPLPAQAKLLRVLEDRQVTRLGGNRAIEMTARVVAATHRDLEQEVTAGRFRQDLYYRLNVHTLRVPPLRERTPDIPVLVEHLLRSIAERLRVRPKTLTPEALALLTACDWRKNNVRELRNCLERMMIASDAAVIDVSDAPPEIRRDEDRDEVFDPAAGARHIEGFEGPGRAPDRSCRAREARLAGYANCRIAGIGRPFVSFEDHAPSWTEQRNEPGHVISCPAGHELRKARVRSNTPSEEFLRVVKSEPNRQPFGLHSVRSAAGASAAVWLPACVKTSEKIDRDKAADH